MAQAKRELETLPPAAQREVVKLSRVMESGGQQAGGKLAQGINASLIRNSPLIAAAVGGALAAGAPLALAGAGVLFGGIGALAASQSSQVRAEWRALGEEISAGALDDARVIIPALSGMADDLGASFARLRPQLRNAFEASVPLLDNVTDGVTALAENAMPGLVRAVQAADPAMAGLESLLGDLGTGVGELFGGLADNAPAAGTALAALGSILGDVLPILGELLGTGAELAGVVLPPVADAVEEVAQALQAVGPVLPAIVAGFTALKVAGAVTGGMKSLSGSLAGVAQQAAFATYQVDGFGRGAAGRASDGASKMGRAVGTASDAIGRMGAVLPGVGVLMTMYAAKLSDAEAQEAKWSQALQQGGVAAQEAAAQAEAASGKYADSWVGNLSRTLDEWAGIQPSMEDAQAAADEYVASLSPLEAAQHKAEMAQQAMTAAVSKFGADSPQARAAMADYERATADTEREQGKLEAALHGVTQAMVDQAMQALAAADSDLGYRMSVNATKDALRDMNEAVREHGTSSEEAQDATLNYEQALLSQANAAAVAAADAAGLAEGLERDEFVAASARAELVRMRDEMGGQFPAALNTAIGRLDASGVAIDATRAAAAMLTGQITGLGIAVTQVPGQKYVKIDAPTAEQKARIEALGHSVVTLPDGSVVVVAHTDNAHRQLDALTRTRYATIIATTQVGSSARAASVQQLAARNLRAAGGPIFEYADGGPITGPGTGTSDSIAAYGPKGTPNYRLSNGEHIITAAEVRAAGGHGAVMQQRQAWLTGFAAGGPVSHKWDPSREGDRAYTKWWDGLLAAGWRGRAGDREERIYAPAGMAAARTAQPAAARPAGAYATVSGGTGGGAVGSDCNHPLFNVEHATIAGPPQEVARLLALEARTRGR